MVFSERPHFAYSKFIKRFLGLQTLLNPKKYLKNIIPTMLRLNAYKIKYYKKLSMYDYYKDSARCIKELVSLILCLNV